MWKLNHTVANKNNSWSLKCKKVFLFVKKLISRWRGTGFSRRAGGMRADTQKMCTPGNSFNQSRCAVKALEYFSIKVHLQSCRLLIDELWPSNSHLLGISAYAYRLMKTIFERQYKPHCPPNLHLTFLAFIVCLFSSSGMACKYKSRTIWKILSIIQQPCGSFEVVSNGMDRNQSLYSRSQNNTLVIMHMYVNIWKTMFR